jgi:hypothetical protein
VEAALMAGSLLFFCRFRHDCPSSAVCAQIQLKRDFLSLACNPAANQPAEERERTKYFITY